jgi:acetyl esterase
MPNP